MRTKRSGRLGLAVLSVALLFGVTTPAAWAAKKRDKKAAAEAAEPAILAGTVFTGVGFALRGAEITITRTDPAAGKEKWKTTSDARGEFFLRLPSGPAKYTVSVRAQGLKPQEKEISFTAAERLEQNFLMEPATGSGK
jgi:Carboxypeptidase regulatory-like domain